MKQGKVRFECRADYATTDPTTVHVPGNSVTEHLLDTRGGGGGGDLRERRARPSRPLSKPAFL